MQQIERDRGSKKASCFFTASVPLNLLHNSNIFARGDCRSGKAGLLIIIGKVTVLSQIVSKGYFLCPIAPVFRYRAMSSILFISKGSLTSSTQCFYLTDED